MSNNRLKCEAIYERLHSAADYDSFMLQVEAERHGKSHAYSNNQQKKEKECISEFRAFGVGGEPGLHRLRHVYRSIMCEHGIPLNRLASILSLAGIYNQKEKKTKNGPSGETYF